MSNLYTQCNYCKKAYPKSEVKGFKCIHCMEKDAKKANKYEKRVVKGKTNG